jgi:hypothetical protein
MRGEGKAKTDVANYYKEADGKLTSRNTKIERVANGLDW